MKLRAFAFSVFAVAFLVGQSLTLRRLIGDCAPPVSVLLGMFEGWLGATLWLRWLRRQ